MVNSALVLVGLTVALASCSSSTERGARAERHNTQPVASVAITTTSDPLERYNPTHDPTKCVRILDDGTVVYTIIEPVPPGTPPNPAAADEPITPSPPLGKCG